ncbi:PREDICTED: putative disease resistance RPP13-like protein 1 [Nelumbo nucifera]|uniref:Disease resistance RPP13-like protein 1 n=1 Tax=Nelumbo nucifera TaxID=4432 RepID=A0A1U8AZG5_NELNU|nr:PREDICTED: putative disease resistance RPP13-like protein 1 [Nelumbo nucifera]
MAEMGEPILSAFFKELNDVAYDAEDTLEEYAVYVKEYQVRRSISPEMKNEIKSKIKKIKERLQKLKRRISVLGLKRVYVEGTMSNEIIKRPSTSSILDESCFFGRETDKNNIITKLLTWGGLGAEKNYGVIPIVGMGGLGKTALAQSVYNDEKVKGHFDLKAWVCVSEKVDTAKITKAILESATTNVVPLTDLDPLQCNLTERLHRKKFLIVLDDVWNEKLEDWEQLRKPFQSGEKGSRVIVTTRSKKVSSIMGTLPAHRLGGLEDDWCWSILRHQASVDDVVLETNPKIEKIGRKIVEKCKGVPLAVKTLGGFLHSKTKEQEWENVLTSEIWELEDTDGIVPSLRLSYQRLPAHLKRCFSYCSIFPKDYIFSKEEELVLLWMGEGFIHPEGNKQIEAIGSEYFEELCFRSFFNPISQYGRGFVMHDLTHDLAQFISKDICFLLTEAFINQGDNSSRYTNNIKARHLSLFHTRTIDDNALDQLIKSKSSSRTFLLFGYISFSQYEYNIRIPSLVAKLDNLFDTWSCLRVLNLRYLDLEHNGLPESIGNLKLLTYLDLSYTKIIRLPESVCSLYHLQTLLLEGLNDYMKELPENISSSLVKLRLVKIDKYKCRIQVEDDRKLYGKCVGLVHLIVSGLENFAIVNDIPNSIFNNNNQVFSKLAFEWDNINNIGVGERAAAMAQQVIERLRPPRIDNKRLELTIKGYYGGRFPPWMVEMPNLTELELKGCKSCKVIPFSQLGALPMLKILTIGEMDNWEGEWSSPAPQFPRPWSLYKYRCFPSLLSLHIYRCPKLKAFSSFLPLPYLQSLRIEHCEGLESLPKVEAEGMSIIFPSLKWLSIVGCPRLMAFSNGGLPIQLQRLEISGCGEDERGLLPYLRMLPYKTLHLFKH